MAMTKKEQAEFERLQKELREAKAIRWPDYPPPGTIPPPSSGHTQGWQFNLYTRHVSEEWSTSIAHGSGRYEHRQGGSKRSQHLYATKEDALRALRLAMTREYARLLAEVDQKIEAADA